MYYWTSYASPLGEMTLAATDTLLLGVWFVGQKHYFGTYKQEGFQVGANAVLQKGVRWLDDYFSGRQPGPWQVPINLAGTMFRRRVWQTLCQIPYGRTQTYAGLADLLQNATGTVVSPQAVGAAVGCNPLAIIIPCHRVIGTGGVLGGYAAGTERKRRLLYSEGVDARRLK